MNDQFRQEMLCEPFVDEQYELFIKAWMAYHKTAHEIDGHLPFGHPDQARLGHLAVRAGRQAMGRYVSPDVIREIIRRNDWEAHHKWHHAKLEALRRLRMR